MITNIKSSDVHAKHVMVEVTGHCIQGISDYYAQKNGVMAILGSSGYLEVSLRNGSACDFLGTAVGGEIRVILPP
jgi:S-adenosylmethionine hydrolase